MRVPLSCLDHDPRFLALAHVLNGPPESVWHLWITQGHLKWFLPVNEDFTFFDLIVAIYLSICADSWSAGTLGQVSIVLEGFALAHLAIFTDDVDLDAPNVLIKH